MGWYNKGAALYGQGKLDESNAAFAKAKELGIRISFYP